MSDGSEQEPLILPQRSALKVHYKSVFVFLFLLFLSSLGFGIANQAVSDAQYLIICRYKGISEEFCFTEPAASELDGLLNSYLNAASSVCGVLEMLIAARALNRFGMRVVCIGFLLISLIGSIGFVVLLSVSSEVHYMWCLGPALFHSLGFFNVGQFFGTIYITEMASDINMRTTFLGWNRATMSLVTILGPALGSYLLRYTSIPRLFTTSAVVNFSAIVAFWGLFTEVNHIKREEEPSALESFKLATGFREQDPIRKRTLQKTAGFFALGSSVVAVEMTLSTIYVKSRFGWSARENGYLRSLSSAAELLSLAVIAPAILYRLNVVYTRHSTEIDRVDKFMGYWYILFAMTGALLTAVFPSPSLYFIVQVLQSLRSVGQPSIFAMCVKFAPEDGLTSFWLGLSYVSIASSVPIVTLALNSYRHTLRIMPESMWWGCFAVLAGALVLLHTLKPRA